MPKSASGRKKNAKPVSEPRLGIFWLVNGRLLLIDSARLIECEQYGDHLNYPGSHNRVWERLQHAGRAPAESEYEEHARGRVMYSARSGFTLLADRCILKRKDLIAAIKKQLCLPRQTSVGTDPHYRCFTCLHGSDDEG